MTKLDPFPVGRMEKALGDARVCVSLWREMKGTISSSANAFRLACGQENGELRFLRFRLTSKRSIGGGELLPRLEGVVRGRLQRQVDTL